VQRAPMWAPPFWFSDGRRFCTEQLEPPKRVSTGSLAARAFGTTLSGWKRLSSASSSPGGGRGCCCGTRAVLSTHLSKRTTCRRLGNRKRTERRAQPITRSSRSSSRFPKAVAAGNLREAIGITAGFLDFPGFLFVAGNIIVGEARTASPNLDIYGVCDSEGVTPDHA